MSAGRESKKKMKNAFKGIIDRLLSPIGAHIHNHDLDKVYGSQGDSTMNVTRNSKSFARTVSPITRFASHSRAMTQEFDRLLK